MFVGGTLAYVSSKKQKCMSKEPDGSGAHCTHGQPWVDGAIQRARFFLDNEPGANAYCLPRLYRGDYVGYKGGGITRTKYLRVRMNLGKEMVDEKRVRVEYVKAAGMIADGFSKPYDPVEH